MTLKDGFKFGIGFFLAASLVQLPHELLDKKSKLYREIDRISAMWKNPYTNNKSNESSVETTMNKIGFTID